MSIKIVNTLVIRKLEDKNVVALAAGVTKVMVDVTKHSDTLRTCFEMCHYAIIVMFQTLTISRIGR